MGLCPCPGRRPHAAGWRACRKHNKGQFREPDTGFCCRVMLLIVRTRFAGAAAFGGYALALLQNSIWYKRNWSSTLKYMADGLVYAMLTAGIFTWLWPA
jgi:hypothetical protein